MNEKKPRRSLISYILPYLLTTALIVMIVWLIVSQLGHSTETWNESDIDTYIGYNVNTKTVDDSGKYYVSHVTYTNKNNAVVVVNGRRYNKEKLNDNRDFTVTIQYDNWDKVFVYNANADASGEFIVHAPYKSIFQTATDNWNASGYAEVYRDKGTLSAVDPYQVSFWDTWGPTIIQVVLIALFSAFLLWRLNSSVSGANRQAMDFNRSPARREDTSKVRFDDVAGCDEEKAEMVEMVDYLKEPKKYSKYGARLPKGALLIGPPGTGKTLLAKAVAGEAGVPFYSISGSDFVEMFVGVGAGRVRDLFKKAKQTAPCVVFIDEIDAVGRQRGAGLGGGNDEREQTLNQLLVEMDGFEYNSGILVVAATNRDDVLDPALLRPGRFDRIITVGLPNTDGREAIFKVHARNKKIDPSVDFHALAKRTVGFSGADIDNILNEAAILAVRFHKDQIGMAEIDEAIDRRISGPAKSSKGMSAEERKQVAFHESGHAIIGLVLPHAEKVQKITIIPRGNTGGHVLMTPEDDRFLMTKKEMLAMITGLLGGRTSEEIFFDDVSSGASNDIQRATRLARSMVTEYGMSDLGPIQYEDASGSVFLGRDYANASKNFSTQIAFEIDKAVREIIDSCHEEAKRIILEHKAEVTLIAETLLEKETITAEEIQSLVQNGRLPEKKVAKIHETDVISAEERERINKVASTPGKRDIEQGSVETTPKVEESPSKPVNLEKTDDSEQK